MEMASSRPSLSVVAPCFNEEASLPEFVRRMRAACEATAPNSYEVILINDGSSDQTWPCIRAIATTHDRIVGLNLARNHGHQLAVSAGLVQASGERVLVIDADLQDPPELLDALMRQMDQGFDVVYGRRRSRASESRLKLATAYLYYRMLRSLAQVDIPSDTGDFRLISRRIVDHLNQMPEQDRFLRGMVAWLGGAQTELLYDREPRFAGKTGYTLSKMVRLALAGVTSFSIVPLRLATLMAMLGGVAAVITAIYVVAGFIAQRTAPGWASLALIVTFFATIQLASLGILGAYVGRIFLQVKGRPLYLIDDVITSKSIEARPVEAKSSMEIVGGSR